MNIATTEIEKIKPKIMEIILGTILGLIFFAVAIGSIYLLIPEDYKYNPFLFLSLILSLIGASTMGKVSQMMLFRYKIKIIIKEKTLNKINSTD